jgi:hypothetical protein
MLSFHLCCCCGPVIYTLLCYSYTYKRLCIYKAKEPPFLKGNIYFSKMLHTDMLMGGCSFESLSKVFAEIGLVWPVVTTRRALSTHPCSRCNKPGLMVEHGVG